MNHLPFNATPVSTLPYFSKKLGVNLICKRDDLFQEAGGGSKARMLQYILFDVNPHNCDLFVTAGGPCSNFNRACALMCARLGVKMHLIEYTDEPQEWNSANYRLSLLAGIHTTRCNRTCVAQTIEDVVSEYERKGLKVKRVYGGGKSLEGFCAYYDSIGELSCQVKNIDYLFVACGTGTTLTGICAGMQKWFPKAKVYAISTARKWEVEQPVLEQNISLLNNYVGGTYNFGNLNFYDNYLCGGYAKYTNELMATIKECISNEGMIIDPTYSGKAFYGMQDIILSDAGKFEGKDVLFWNTGGVFNLL